MYDFCEVVQATRGLKLINSVHKRRFIDCVLGYGFCRERQVSTTLNRFKTLYLLFFWGAVEVHIKKLPKNDEGENIFEGASLNISRGTNPYTSLGRPARQAYNC